MHEPYSFVAYEHLIGTEEFEILEDFLIDNAFPYLTQTRMVYTHLGSWPYSPEPRCFVIGSLNAEQALMLKLTFSYF
jgi:hypothetical protein